MKIIYPHTKESGVVSILSVIFFIILMSIMAVSFLRIVTDEQQQVVQDDLGKGALAAAQSGVEDAKRALLHCRTLSGAARNSCFASLGNQTCPGMFADPGLVSALGLNPYQSPDGSPSDGSIRVGDPLNNNDQRYTCVTMSQDTTDYVGMLSTGLGSFIPLRSTGPFNQVRISWHETSMDGIAAVPNAGSPIANDSNPRQPQWQSAPGVGYIAMPRVQLVEFNPSLTLNAQENNSSGAFLVPSRSGGSTVNVNGINASGMPKRAVVNCNGAQSGYMCTATLNLNFAKPAGAQYFMLLKSQYGTPHYKVELLNSGSVVTFNDVQPQVDSTGAVGNVFKRVLSRIEYQADTFFTSNALESGLSICKNFFVTISEFNNDDCVGMLPSGATLNSNSGAAGIGGYCAVHVCVSGDDGGAISWDETIVNLSQVDPANVASCVWNFGDGSPNSNTHCNRGDSFIHTFPSDPAYLTNPNLPKINYTVTLTVNLRSGGSSTANYTFRLPEHYP